MVRCAGNIVRAAALLGGVALAVAGGGAVAASPPGPPSVKIISARPTTVTGKHSAVTFRLRITGLVLDPKHLGKKNISGHGHIQVYVDKIPSDAYSKKDLKHHWLASLSSPDFSLSLKPTILGGKGKHTIIVALAQNDDVLYRIPTAKVTITAK